MTDFYLNHNRWELCFAIEINSYIL